MKTSMPIILIIILILTGSFVYGETSSSKDLPSSRISLDEKKIEKIMDEAYKKLKNNDAWQLHWEQKFDKEKQIPTVKALLENETDLRWAKILLDERILSSKMEKEFTRITGIIWALSSGASLPFQTHPLNEEFGLIPGDGKSGSELIGTKATLKTIKSLYGDPSRIEKVKNENKERELEVNYFGLVSFYTDPGNDEIKGLKMPFVFFKLGYRDFAKLIINSTSVKGKKNK
jgi:hypothetical protein